MFGCHSCKWRENPGRLERCLACSTASEEKINSVRIGCGGAVSLDSVSDPQVIIRHSPKPERPPSEPSGQCTDLPEGVEDQLRMLLSTFIGLEDYDCLLLVHLCRGETIAESARSIPLPMPGKVANGGDRRHAWARLERLVKAFKPFGAIVQRALPPKTERRKRRKSAEQMELF